MCARSAMRSERILQPARPSERSLARGTPRLHCSSARQTRARKQPPPKTGRQTGRQTDTHTKNEERKQLLPAPAGGSDSLSARRSSSPRQSDGPHRPAGASDATACQHATLSFLSSAAPDGAFPCPPTTTHHPHTHTHHHHPHTHTRTPTESQAGRRHTRRETREKYVERVCVCVSSRTHRAPPPTHPPPTHPHSPPTHPHRESKSASPSAVSMPCHAMPCCGRLPSSGRSAPSAGPHTASYQSPHPPSPSPPPPCETAGGNGWVTAAQQS
eukprot:COSAG02_NODE_3562_length_6554_cov_8.462277_3_plen_271_part_00